MNEAVRLQFPGHRRREETAPPAPRAPFASEHPAPCWIKGDDFRSRYKPPAKALDFVASGVPVAMNPGTSSAEHLARLGLAVPSPLDVDRWLSKEYWEETQKLGRRLSVELAPERVAHSARQIVEAVLGERLGRSFVSRIAKPRQQSPPADPAALYRESQSLAMQGHTVAAQAILADLDGSKLSQSLQALI